MTHPNRRIGAGIALLLLALAAALILGALPAAGLFADRARVAEIVGSAGPWGPLVLIALTAAQVAIAPIPGQAVDFVAGYLYGFWLGALYAWLGLVLGSIFAISLARMAGRPLVERLVSREQLARLDGYAGGQGLLFFFLVFLVPFLPDDLICYVAGFSRLPLAGLFAVAAIGRIPGLVAAVWLGAYAEQVPWPVWVATGLAAVIVILLGWRYGRQIQDALLRRARRRPTQGEDQSESSADR